MLTQDLYIVKMGSLGYAILREKPEGVTQGGELVNYVLEEMFSFDKFDLRFSRSYVNARYFELLQQLLPHLGIDPFRGVYIGYYITYHASEEEMEKLTFKSGE